MKLGELSTGELRRRLRGNGLQFRSGSFVFNVRTRIASVIDGIALLYSEFPLDESAFADFHVQLDAIRFPHRIFHPQVVFRLDGRAPFKPLPLDQAFAMFEWGLNYCVSSHAQDTLIIHAAVIEKNGRAAILPAPPGSGKSTLCAALVARGWRLLSDELTLIRLSDHAIVPAPRPVSLKNGSIDVIRSFQPDAVLSRPVHDTMKGTVAHVRPPADSVARAGEACRAGFVVFPQWQAGAPTEMVELPQSRGFMRVADNAFNYSLLGAAGFEALAGVIDDSRCYEFTYSVLEEAISAFDALLAEAPVAEQEAA